MVFCRCSESNHYLAQAAYTCCFFLNPSNVSVGSNRIVSRAARSHWIRANLFAFFIFYRSGLEVISLSENTTSLRSDFRYQSSRAVLLWSVEDPLSVILSLDFRPVAYSLDPRRVTQYYTISFGWNFYSTTSSRIYKIENRLPLPNVNWGLLSLFSYWCALIVTDCKVRDFQSRRFRFHRKTQISKYSDRGSLHFCWFISLLCPEMNQFIVDLWDDYGSCNPSSSLS